MIAPTVRAGLVIAAIAVASGIAGAAIDRTVVARHQPPRGGGFRGGRPTPEQESSRRKDMLDHLTKDLSLSVSQRAGLDSVFQRSDSSLRAIRREMQPRLQQVFESGRVEIMARLDSAQRVKFSSMRQMGGGPPRGGGFGPPGGAAPGEVR